MSLSVKGMALSLGTIAGGACLLAGLLNLIFPGYAQGLLDLAASVYPGYHGPAGIGSVIVVTMYGFVDGVAGGILIAWLYNSFSAQPAGER